MFKVLFLVYFSVSILSTIAVLPLVEAWYRQRGVQAQEAGCRITAFTGAFCIIKPAIMSLSPG